MRSRRLTFRLLAVAFAATWGARSLFSPAAIAQSSPPADATLHSAPSFGQGRVTTSVLPARSTPDFPSDTTPPDTATGLLPGQINATTSPTIPSGYAPPHIKASSAILVDAVSGQVLYAWNADQERPMASTTKIMTALLFCEHVPETDIIVASKHASETRESSLHLKRGEKISAHDLLRALLLRSANDGCVAAAEHVAGTEAAFVEMMNTRAQQLGALHTHFTNPHGLHAKMHYTTARDLAMIACEAIKQPRINAVTCIQRCRISRSKDNRDVTLRNHSHFLGHFPGADGIKTGWTRPAGHCYVGSATWNGWRLISVVLNSPDYVHETGALMKYGFFHYKPNAIARMGESAGVCPVQGGVQPTVPIAIQNRMQVVSARGETPRIEKKIQLLPVTAPVHAGQVIGSLMIAMDDRPVCSSPLLAAQYDPVQVALVGHISPAAKNRFWLFATILGLTLVSLRYGKRTRNRIAAFAKSARRRRRRLAKSLRDFNHGR